MLFVHRVRQAGEQADYLVAGTVFPTASKPGVTPLLGLDGLSAVVRAVRQPVLAIGGLSLTRIHEVARAGAGTSGAFGKMSLTGDRSGVGMPPVTAEMSRSLEAADRRKLRLGASSAPPANYALTFSVFRSSTKNVK